MAKKHKEFADLLKKLDILPAENHDLFLKELRVSRSINHNIDLLRLLNKTLIIDNKNYPDEPEDYYPMVHREVTQVFPELAFDQLQVHVAVDEEESDEDYIAHKAVVSFEVDDKTYKRANYYNPDYKTDDFDEGRFDDKFCNIFNKVFLNRHLDYRLYTFESITRQRFFEPSRSAKIGIIGLSHEQYEMLVAYDDFMVLSYKDNLPNVPNDEIDQITEVFKELGLLDHLDDEEIAHGNDINYESDVIEKNELVLFFRDLALHFDFESAEDKNRYKNLTLDFKRISQDRFQPTNIKDNLFKAIEDYTSKDQKVDYSFKVGEKVYSTQLRFNGDWVDGHFIDLINFAVQENVEDGKFYPLDYDGLYIFLSKNQYGYLKEHQYLEFSKFL